MRPLSDADFDAVREHLRATAGLAFDEGRRGGLAAVVADRLRETGAPDVPTYLGSLTSHADIDHRLGDNEQQRLLDAVTVQETQFFRNAPQIEALRRRVLPELLRRTAGRARPLTIWSAGCSTGEEPYTLAMLLLELAPALGRDTVRIIGTDVSAEALRAAARATYTGRSVESVPTIVRDRWFEPRPGGALGVGNAARALVELRRHNLVTEPVPFAPGEVDLVVCRNVTIYFHRDTTSRLVGTFHHVLAEGGYLLLGHAETLWQVSDAFTLLPVGDAFVYRRSHESGSQADERQPAQRGSAAGRSEPRRSELGRSESARRRRVVPARQPVSPESRAATALTEALAQMRTGDYRSAAGRAEAAVRADPLLAAAYIVLGRARATLGQDQVAVAPLRNAVYLDPTAGDAHFLLGGALARLGRFSAAAASYRAAAATVHLIDDDTRQELLDGRGLAELVHLCQRLGEAASERAAAESTVEATHA